MPEERKHVEGQITLNNYGTMYEQLDDVVQLAIDLLNFKKKSFKALDAGCAFGFVSKELLKNEQAFVIANDISETHLDALKQSYLDGDGGSEKLNRLELKSGNFVDLNIDADSLDAIFALRVVHFLDGEQLKETLKKFYTWLKPGGLLALTTSSPFNWTVDQPEFINEYRRRLNEPTDEHHNWPGTVSDTSRFVKNEETLKVLPKKFTCFSVDELVRESLNVGFNIYRCSYVDRSAYVKSLGNNYDKTYSAILVMKDIFSSS